MEDRQKGCLYGLAIGDALGAAVEFRMQGEFAPVTCYRSGGPHCLEAGEWTDDTSMALALADSLAKGWDTRDQLQKYLDWYNNGTYSVNGKCFDIGSTTRYALDNFERHGTIVAEDDPKWSGNGSIMRLAPVPIVFHNTSQLAEYAADSSATTHGSDQCKESCVYMAEILAGFINGKSKEEVLRPDFTKKPSIIMVEKIRQGRFKPADAHVEGSGWVIDSLNAALWAFWNSDSFEEAVLKAVNLGDDADTTGAVCGQIAGAYYGYSKIPASLIDGLARKDMIDQYLNPLLKIGYV